MHSALSEIVSLVFVSYGERGFYRVVLAMALPMCASSVRQQLSVKIKTKEKETAVQFIHFTFEEITSTYKTEDGTQTCQRFDSNWQFAAVSCQIETFVYNTKLSSAKFLSCYLQFFSRNLPVPVNFHFFQVGFNIKDLLIIFNGLARFLESWNTLLVYQMGQYIPCVV